MGNHRKPIEHFISPEPTSGCWLWTGWINQYGYARFGADGKLVHRLLWEREHGPIPHGLCICHKCDVACCVNPEHMFLGTREDNNRDMMRKERANLMGWKGYATHCPNGHPYDETNTYWHTKRKNRSCKICNRARAQRRQAVLRSL